MRFTQLTDFPFILKGVVELSTDGLKVLDEKRFRGEIVDELILSAVFGSSEDVRDAARWIIWEAAHELGAFAASINDLYFARGQEKYKDVCVPAINIRGLTYDTARMIFRAAEDMNGGPFIFEIAKSEIGYTMQRPAEYTACVLAAAIREGYKGPVFIQGDHFQVNLKKYQENPDKELSGVKSMIDEALAAGFYNIDIDTSTLVDLDKKTIKEQQELNYTLSAELTAYIRKNEPEGVCVSVGGEIGEVGGKNSTVEEMEAYIGGYLETLANLAPGSVGISKISVQTGTSHGGVPLADGSIAEVALDFNVLESLAKVGRDKFKIGGTVQHGASTLPDTAFHKFKETQACEVHLATGFQNLVMDHEQFPTELRERIYAWLTVNCAKERKDGQTEEQFLYKSRKKGFGPYKWETWTMPEASLAAILDSLKEKFTFLFDQLGIRDSKKLAQEFIKPIRISGRIPRAFKQLIDDPNKYGMQSGVEEDAPGAD